MAVFPSPHGRRVSRHGHVRDTPGGVEHRQRGWHSSSPAPRVSAPHAHPIVQESLRTLRDVDDLPETHTTQTAHRNAVRDEPFPRCRAGRKKKAAAISPSRHAACLGQRGRLSLPFRKGKTTHKIAESKPKSKFIRQPDPRSFRRKTRRV